MSNQNTEAAQAYHESTKLSYINLRNKPPIYKSYDGLRVFPPSRRLSHAQDLDAGCGCR